MEQKFLLRLIEMFIELEMDTSSCPMVDNTVIVRTKSNRIYGGLLNKRSGQEVVLTETVDLTTYVSDKNKDCFIASLCQEGYCSYMAPYLIYFENPVTLLDVCEIYTFDNADALELYISSVRHEE